MKEYILKNNVKLIYKHSDSELTSICISLNAGAGVEKEKLGVAHATEHMFYKGTKNRSEQKINEDLSNIFGFNNAMTNYPYVIYYGTLLGEDLSRGVELFSDIILNPKFSTEGFKEEMDVIKEELKEWDEELEQYCEDKLFYNTFEERRIKYPIIGTEESLESMTLNDIKDFYEEHYFPENTSIVIISSLKFENVKNIVNEYFSSWNRKFEDEDIENGTRIRLKSDNQDKVYKLDSIIKTDKFINREIKYDHPKVGKFNDKREGIKTCKVEIICPIDSLNENEMRALRIFNMYFAEGINSILYDTLRTKQGLIYDVIPKIAHENYIKLYKITFGTSKEKLEKALQLVNECIENICTLRCLENVISDDNIQQLIKNYKLKRLFREEQSIVLAKELATYDSMFGDYNVYINEISDLNLLTKETIFEVGKRVLENSTVQIIE